MNDIPYLQRGISPVSTESSVLVSSSKYLNHPRMREWISTITLKRNGPDRPAQTEMYEVISILNEIQDLEYIEDLFTRERKSNPELDRWLSEGFMSQYKESDFEAYAPGTLGHVFYTDVIKQNFDIVIYDQDTPRTQYEYFRYRSGQTHDLEHIMTGGDFHYMGELVPAWARITSHFKFFSPELAGELSVLSMFVNLRYTVRTMLHYPHVWPVCQNAVERGMRVGRESGPFFMARYEDAFDLPLEEARAKLGYVGAENVDTSAASAAWAERA
ncbi:MAG: hypothetical protein JSR28_08200 [Proteobacteria bacterium]|nr:hypothetical protein [Pseudomonadota bacterium]